MENALASDKSRSMPSELMGRTPRKVRLTGVGWAYAVVGASIFLLGLAGMAKVLHLSENERATQSALRQDGGESLGRVTRKWGRGTSRYISYSFSVGRDVYLGDAETPIEIWNSLHEGDPLPVRYLPSTPDVNHPAAWAGSTILWSLVLPGFLLPFSLLFVWRFPLQRRVAIEGIPAWACILERERTSASKGQQWESYTFRRADGELEYGRCPMDVCLKTGSTVCVLYLPGKPSRSAIYPLDFFKIEQ